MHDQKVQVAIRLNALMSLSAESYELYQALTPIMIRSESDYLKQNGHSSKISGFGDFSGLIALIGDALLTKLCLNISMIGYNHKDSINIYEFLDYVNTYSNIFTANRNLVIQKCTEFGATVESLKPKADIIIGLRHQLLAHTSKELVQRHLVILEAFRSFNIGWDEFFDIVEKLLMTYRNILEYFNQICDPDYQMTFQVNENTGFDFHMNKLIDKLT